MSSHVFYGITFTDQLLCAKYFHLNFQMNLILQFYIPKGICQSISNTKGRFQIHPWEGRVYKISALCPPDTDPHIRTKYQGVFELFFDDPPPPPKMGMQFLTLSLTDMVKI